MQLLDRTLKTNIVIDKEEGNTHANMDDMSKLY